MAAEGAANEFRHCFDVKGAKDGSRFSLSQNQRRKQMLMKQRERMENKLENLRAAAIAADPEPTEDDQDQMNTVETTESSNPEESMDTDAAVKPKRKKRNLLMKHELLEEIPTDLREEWVCMPIPEGQRCLVASSNQQTIAKSETGELLEKFRSYLPNGSHSSSDKKESYCVFDCIYHDPSSTFYILDMMCWRGNLYYNCDAAFRSFFMHTKLSEIPYVSQITDNNPYRFVALPAFECTTQGITNACNPASIGLPPTVVTFYNRNTHYTTGETNPLVCYLPIDRIPPLLQTLNQ